MTERRQFGGWPHRPRDESGPIFCRELLRHFLSELCGLNVDLVYPVAQIEFAENDRASAKRIGLDDVAAHAEKIRMNVADDVGTAQHQHFAAILLAPVIVQGGIALLDVGSHGAVVHHDALFHSLQKVSH